MGAGNNLVIASVYYINHSDAMMTGRGLGGRDEGFREGG